MKITQTHTLDERDICAVIADMLDCCDLHHTDDHDEAAARIEKWWPNKREFVRDLKRHFRENGCGPNEYHHRIYGLGGEFWLWRLAVRAARRFGLTTMEMPDGP